MAFSPFDGGRGDETCLRFAPASGFVLFLLAQKKNQKKGAPSPYRSAANAFALWASTALNTDRCVSPAFQAVDPIRRSRSSNGNGVSRGLRAAEGNIPTSRSYEKCYKMPFKGGKCSASLRHGVMECRPHPGKGFEIASRYFATFSQTGPLPSARPEKGSARTTRREAAGWRWFPGRFGPGTRPATPRGPGGR